MKQLLITFMSLFLSIPSGKSQHMCGVYKTANDLKYQQFNITADRQTKGHAIEVSNFFMQPYIYVNHGGKKKKISMDSIYAFKQPNGKIYRIWQRKCYQLIDSCFLKIFSFDARKTKMVPTSRSARPVTVTQKEYYFCCDYSESLQPLTFNNIILTIHADKALREALLHRFNSQQELIEVRQAQQTSINLFLKNYKQQQR